VLWLSADLRDEWRKLDGIEQAWRDVTIGRPAETSAAARTVQGGEAARATTAAR
jgi:hypothetical protein